VLWIDADERLDARATAAIHEALRGGGERHWYRIRRAGFFLGRRIRWCGWQGERLARLFRRDAGRFDDAQVHERLHVTGPGGELAGVLEHRSYETWRECVDKMTRYAAANAEQSWRAGRRAGALDLFWRPPLRFVRQYVLQAGWLDGVHGLALCALAAAQVFLKYAELWDRTRRAQDPR